MFIHADTVLFNADDHLWLVAGALTAALTYSGTAAIHAAMLVWIGPNPTLERDNHALYAILSAACLITVPLLNWSTTLRRLGQKVAGLSKTNADVGTRTIVIYWAFLVAVGFTCIWVGTIKLSTSDSPATATGFLPDMAFVSCAVGTNASQVRGEDGTFYPQAIGPVFVNAHNCTDPCNTLTAKARFRRSNDLVLLSEDMANLVMYTPIGDHYLKREKQLYREAVVLGVAFFIYPYILLQGIFTACFGRREPREIRDLIFIKLLEIWPSNRRWLRAIQKWSVRFFALFIYLGAVLIMLLCAPLFIASIITIEMLMWQVDLESEQPFMIGQWSPLAAAGLIILAALIAKFHDPLVGKVASLPIFRGSRGVPIWAGIDHKTFSDIEAASKSNAKPSLRQDEVEYHRTSNDQGPGKRRFLDVFRRLLSNCRTLCRSFVHSLVHSENLDVSAEMNNFYAWCKDPETISKIASRHPLRDADSIGAGTSEADVQAAMKRQSGTNAQCFFRGVTRDSNHIDAQDHHPLLSSGQEVQSLLSKTTSGTQLSLPADIEMMEPVFQPTIWREFTDAESIER